MYQLKDYDYHLPEDRIAQHPAAHRSQSRLLHLNRCTRNVSHAKFKDITNILSPGDLLVVNNTRVIPARLNGFKESGGKVEVLIIDYASGMAHLKEQGVFRCDCLIKASKRPKPGTRIDLGDGLNAVVDGHDGPVSKVRFESRGEFMEVLEQLGSLPLPPYIRRPLKGDDRNPDAAKVRDQDRLNYQTVYAEQDGAVAAPTAGLHFTDDLILELKHRGIEMAALTLHVGYGTFVPVRVNDIRDHDIHHEFFSLPEELSRKIKRVKARGGRVVAVGTTVVRTLEFCTDGKGGVIPQQGTCDLFIYPGFEFKVVDAMITNFHLPESTLLMLVSAFHDREHMLSVYQEAVTEKYRFFSYGDAMLIE
ncbi:MAG: tRNA preQ1(34) S-adenosylmethionine ribosyltransferase-isomerase QueA [Desulfobacteraceae bacterium]|nr:MAG: tRNA preQ1(34) S-adenosylmethionine ribosyltransferase-isomerase QueA [Desulfobacteraceae bacterium]